MSYAIIKAGGKQYRVTEGERLLVDRLGLDEGASVELEAMLLGGDGDTKLAPGSTVSARVVRHVLGDKIRIGKYRPKSGYRKHTGFRASLTEIQIESLGGGRRKAAASAKPASAKAEKPAAKPAEKPAAKAAEKPAEAPAREWHPPKGYEDMTVAQIQEDASGWRRPNIEAALEHERANANRKGAIAALEAALQAKEESS